MPTEQNRCPPANGSTRLCFTISIVVILAVVLFGGCGSRGNHETAPDDQELVGMTRNPPLVVDSASLPNVNPDRENRSETFRAGKDDLLLVFFGFTFCPDVCPTTLADLRLALAELDPAERERVEVAMVTVDPKRDSAKVLNRYVGHFFPKDSFAAFRTPDANRLSRVEERFEAAHELGEPEKDGSYDVAHTAQVYAVDDRGVVRVEWPFGSRYEDIAADIERLLDEGSGSPADDIGN